MRLHRLTLRHVRGVEECTLDFAGDEELPTGVIVVEGPNEAGKSTLGDALYRLLTSKASSTAAAVRGLKPVDRDEGPEIEADLSIGGDRVVYAKRFLKRPSTQLTHVRPPHGTVQGDEAHELVQQLLHEHLDWGLWESLRLRQDAGLEQVGPGGTSGLASAIAGHVPGDTGAIGERELGILERIRAEYGRYRTSRTGSPTGELREAEQQVASLAEALAAVDGRRAELQDDVDAADRLLRELPSLAGQVEQSAERARELRGERLAVEQLREGLEARERDVAGARERRDRLRGDLERRQRLVEELAVAEAEREELAARAADLGEATGRAAERLEAARGRLVAAEDDRLRARAEREAARSDLDLIVETAALVRLRDRARRATEAREREREATGQLEGIVVDEELLAELRAAETAVARTDAVLDAASPELTVTARADLDVRVDDLRERLSTGDARAWPVRSRLQVQLGELADIEVTAGVGADEAREGHRRATAARAELLVRARVDDLDRAEAELRRRTGLEQQADRARRDREAALDGLGGEELEEEIHRLERRMAVLQEDRHPGVAVPTDSEAARRVLDRATAAEREAEGALAEPAAEVERARTAHDGVRGRHVRERTRAEEADRTAARLRSELEEARRCVADAQLEQQLADAEWELTAAEAARDRAAGELEEAEPERVAALTDNAEAAAGDARDRHAEALGRLRELRAAIAARGGEGLHEQHEDLATELAHARSRLSGLRRRSEAAGRLLEVLLDHRDRTRERYAAPLRDQLVRYGRVLHGPGFDVELDDDLRVARRMLDGRSLEVGQLSVGAREQLALLGRLACATLLGEQGGVLVVDDALGNTDPGRLEAVGAVLREAGQHGQVIVLTCYPDRYRHVGGARWLRL